MNNKAKGSRREREVRDKFIKMDYDVIKSGGSLGVFDIICIPKKCPSAIIAVQVKSNRISPLEIDEIIMHDTTARKEIWIKKDFSRTWERYIFYNDCEYS